jgi:hypothetical protein
VGRRADRHEPLVVHVHRDEVGRRVGLVAQPERRVAAPDERADLDAERGAQPQVHARVGIAEAPQPLGQRRARERADERQRHGPGTRAPHRVDRVDPVAQRREQQLGVGQERAARIGEQDAGRDPLEQRRAELRLQQLDPAARRRLRQVQVGGRAGEAAVPGDREEGLHVGELHAISVLHDDAT